MPLYYNQPRFTVSYGFSTSQKTVDMQQELDSKKHENRTKKAIKHDGETEKYE